MIKSPHPAPQFFSLSYDNINNGLVRIVEQPAVQTAGVLTVKELEMNKMVTHSNALESIFCGFDRWFDNVNAGPRV